MADPEQVAFQQGFNRAFNEQFNRDYVTQQHLLAANQRLKRTRQSVEAERRNRVGPTTAELQPYPLHSEDTLRPSQLRKQVFTQTVECNLLNQLYMSAENMENLQQRIRYEVYLASDRKHVIGRQSQDELAIIMRSIYLTYGRNLPVNIKGQIEELNDLVVRECVPRILSQIVAHERYLFDASTQPMPLAWPQNMSNKGMKILPSVTSVFNT